MRLYSILCVGVVLLCLRAPSAEGQVPSAADSVAAALLRRTAGDPVGSPAALARLDSAVRLASPATAAGPGAGVVRWVAWTELARHRLAAATRVPSCAGARDAREAADRAADAVTGCDRWCAPPLLRVVDTLAVVRARADSLTRALCGPR